MSLLDKESYIKSSVWCSFIAAILYLLWVVSMFILPENMLPHSPGNYLNVDGSTGVYIFHQLSFIFASLFMIPVVIVFFALARDNNKGLVSFVTVLGVIGFIFSAFSRVKYLLLLDFLQLNQSFLSSQPIVYQAHLQHAFELSFFGFFLVGVWFFVNAFLAFTNEHVPKILSLMGFFLGLVIQAILIVQILDMLLLSKILFTVYTGLILTWIFWEQGYLKSTLTRLLEEKEPVFED